jgi:endonuclease-3
MKRTHTSSANETGSKSRGRSVARATAEKAVKKSPRSQGAAGVKRRSAPAADSDHKNQARRTLRGLKRLYPDANCALDHSSALELLVATILSAQSTDANVNRVTPDLFRRFPTAKALAESSTAELERVVHSTGFFRQKARSIQECCRLLEEEYGGEVPSTMEDLVRLKGVARKTANVILGSWFGKSEGVVVDTHVGRLAHRLGLTWSSKDAKDAVKIERDLMEVVPRADWTFFSHAIILHGRQVCSARSPKCAECALAKHCPADQNRS